MVHSYGENVYVEYIAKIKNKTSSCVSSAVVQNKKMTIVLPINPMGHSL